MTKLSDLIRAGRLDEATRMIMGGTMNESEQLEFDDFKEVIDDASRAIANKTHISVSGRMKEKPSGGSWGGFVVVSGEIKMGIDLFKSCFLEFQVYPYPHPTSGEDKIAVIETSIDWEQYGGGTNGTRLATFFVTPEMKLHKEVRWNGR